MIVSKFILVTIIAAGVAAITASGQSSQGPSLVVGAGLLLLAARAPWKFYRLLPLMEAGALHHFREPFRGGWHRWRRYGWQRARATQRQWNPSNRGNGNLPIAGQTRQNPPVRPPIPTPRPTPPPPGPGPAPGVVPTGRPGWQRHTVGGGHLLVPVGFTRNPRSTGVPAAPVGP